MPSPRKTRSPSRLPGIRMEALPISQRSPTVAPTTRQRCPKTVRRPIVVGIAAVPMTTQFSITAEPVPMATAPSSARTTAPSERKDRAPREGWPITTADDCDYWSVGPLEAARAGESLAHG